MEFTAAYATEKQGEGAPPDEGEFAAAMTRNLRTLETTARAIGPIARGAATVSAMREAAAALANLVLMAAVQNAGTRAAGTYDAGAASRTKETVMAAMSEVAAAAVENEFGEGFMDTPDPWLAK